MACPSCGSNSKGRYCTQCGAALNATKLAGLKFNRVSLVGSPANELARVALYKRAPETKEEPMEVTQADAEQAVHAFVVKKLRAQGKESLADLVLKKMGPPAFGRAAYNAALDEVLRENPSLYAAYAKSASRSTAVLPSRTNVTADVKKLGSCLPQYRNQFEAKWAAKFAAAAQAAQQDTYSYLQTEQGKALWQAYKEAAAMGAEPGPGNTAA
jgi:hypothetical protein